MTPTCKQVRELGRQLSKAELLALMDKRWLWIGVSVFDITLAKLTVLQQKADDSFAEWVSYDLPNSGESIDDHLKYITAIKEKDKLYKRHERICKKVDRCFAKLEALRIENAAK